MLKGNNDQDLKNQSVNEELVPFVQIWHEMVYNFTLDVYQYRILNSLTALKELSEVIKKTIEGVYTTNHNIDCCRLETLDTIKRDPILEKYEKGILNRLKLHLGTKVEKPHEQKTLAHQVQYVIRKIEKSYLNDLFTELYKAITDSNYELITEYTNSTVSQCVSNGWSPRALFELTRYFRGPDRLENKWQKFKTELCSNTQANFDTLIHIPFTDSATKGRLQNIGLVIKSYDELILEYSYLTDIKSLLKNGKNYIQQKVESADIYSAAHISIRRLSEPLNFASFYNLIDTWDIKSINVISINISTRYHKSIRADDLYQTYDYLDNSNNIFDSTKNIFTSDSKNGIKARLQGSFAYTNISRVSLFQEEKYINLWVAIESLAKTEMYPDIISNVKEVLPAALCLRYVYRIVRNFVEDCGRCGIEFCFTDRIIDMKQESKRQLVQETIDLLRNDQGYSELLQKCDVHTMLKHRCVQIQKLVSDVSYALKKIENHYNKVKWQVQRLYRIRNEIAHSALQEQSSLIILIEHMYDYLSIFILEIVMSIENKKLETLGEVFTVIKDNYELFIELAKSKDQQTHNILYDTVLKTGTIDLLFESYRMAPSRGGN